MCSPSLNINLSKPSYYRDENNNQSTSKSSFKKPHFVPLKKSSQQQPIKIINHEKLNQNKNLLKTAKSDLERLLSDRSDYLESKKYHINKVQKTSILISKIDQDLDYYERKLKKVRECKNKNLKERDFDLSKIDFYESAQLRTKKLIEKKYGDIRYFDYEVRKCAEGEVVREKSKVSELKREERSYASSSRRDH